MSFISNFNKESKISFFIKTELLKKRKNQVSNALLKKRLSKYKNNFYNTSNRIAEIKHFTKNLSLISALQLNTQIRSVKKNLSDTNSNLILNLSTINLNVEKELYQNRLFKQRQNYFLLKELVSSFTETNNLLLRLENSLYSNKELVLCETTKNVLMANYKSLLFYSKPYALFFNNSFAYNNYSFLNYYIWTIFTRIFSSLFKSNTLSLFPIAKNYNLYTLSTNNFAKWESGFMLSTFNPMIKKTNRLNLKQQKISSYLTKRSFNVQLFNRSVLGQTKQPIKLKTLQYLWKQGFLGSKYRLLGQSVLPLNNDRRYNFTKKQTAFQISYIISRIDDKIFYYTEKQTLKEVEHLKKLKTLLLTLVTEKKSRVKKHSFILSKKTSILRIKRRRWSNILTSELKTLCLASKKTEYKKFVINTINKLFKIRTNPVVLASKQLLGNSSRLGNINVLKTKGSRFIFKNKKQIKSSLAWVKPTTSFARSLYYFKVLKRENLLNRSYSQHKSLRKRLVNGRWLNAKESKRAYQPIVLRKTTETNRNQKSNIRRNWVDGKLVLAGRVLSFKEKKLLISSWVGTPVDLFFINALSFTKFAFKFERLLSPKNNPNNFLSVLDRDFINKYKYIGIYIKDLVRIALISMFFKKPSFLAKFVAFQLSKLPRNRKETSFIRFLIKVIKTLGAERKEILGVRIKFKGRVNRWRRTKFILGSRGSLPLHTMDERIEQGTAQAINRKGAVGIRIWVRYKNSFGMNLRNHIFQYMKYSRLIASRQLKRKVLIS